MSIYRIMSNSTTRTAGHQIRRKEKTAFDLDLLKNLQRLSETNDRINTSVIQ